MLLFDLLLAECRSLPILDRNILKSGTELQWMDQSSSSSSRGSSPPSTRWSSLSSSRGSSSSSSRGLHHHHLGVLYHHLGRLYAAVDHLLAVLLHSWRHQTLSSSPPPPSLSFGTSSGGACDQDADQRLGSFRSVCRLDRKEPSLVGESSMEPIWHN